MKKIKPIGTVAEEKRECIAAFKRFPNAIAAWCCHHEKLKEILRETPIKRIRFIAASKPLSEQAIRYRNFRPIKKLKKLKAAYPDWLLKQVTVADLHRQWPHNTWNGRTIFSTKSGYPRYQ